MPNNPPTFLIVEDSKLHHQLYDLVLSGGKFAGCKIIHAYDGREGYSLFVSEPDISMVFLDVNMPVMNGLEFLRRRQEEQIRLDTPIILVTVEGSEEVKAQGLAAGAADYLCKPFSSEELENIASKYLRLTD